MDFSRMGEALIRLDHRHTDGTWGTLERRQEHHDPSAHDPEAGWARGRRLRLHDLRRAGPRPLSGRRRAAPGEPVTPVA